MTVGKIYAGLLIAENWKAYKNSQSKMGGVMGMVSNVAQREVSLSDETQESSHQDAPAVDKSLASQF